MTLTRGPGLLYAVGAILFGVAAFMPDHSPRRVVGLVGLALELLGLGLAYLHSRRNR